MKINLSYEDNGSALHRLNPLVKLVWALSLTTLVVLLEHPVYLLALFLSTLALVGAARIWTKWASIMRLTVYLCLTIALINVLVNSDGAHVLWQAGFKIPVLGYPQVTLEALVFSLGMSIRLLTIISVFTIVTLTIHPDDIIQAMFKVKIPPKSVMVMSLAVRFLPVLVADAGRISAVQQSRGMKSERGNLIQWIKNRSAVLIPLFSNSLDRTVQLAEAMESRGFGSGKPRIFYKPLGISNSDRLTFSLCLLAVGIVAVMSLKGWAAYRYYPVLDSLQLNTVEGWLLFLLVILITSLAPLALIAKGKQIDKI
jgi:energy-coupling factor transport system permease protein